MTSRVLNLIPKVYPKLGGFPMWFLLPRFIKIVFGVVSFGVIESSSWSAGLRPACAGLLGDFFRLAQILDTSPNPAEISPELLPGRTLRLLWDSSLTVIADARSDLVQTNATQRSSLLDLESMAEELTTTINPWRLGLHPLESTKFTAFSTDSSLVRYLGEIPQNGEQILESLRKPVPEIDFFGDDSPALGFFRSLDLSRPLQKEDVDRELRALPWVSLFQNPLYPLETKKAVIEVFEFLKPRELIQKPEFNLPGTSRIIFRELIFEFLYNPGAWDGLRLAAFNLWSRVESQRTPKANENLFLVLQKSFEEAGFSRNDSLEWTWKTLGLISSKGTGIGPALWSWTQGRGGALAFYMATIAHASDILDLRGFSKNRLWSLPLPHRTHFWTGKSYHFWMSAFLTHHLVKKGFSRKAAARAVWICQLGYQYGSKTVGRDPNKAFLLDSRTSDYHLGIRMDLVMSSAGIYFGKNFSGQTSGDPPEIDLTAALLALQSAGRDFTPGTPPKNGYLKKWQWLQIFSAQTALKFFHL